MEVYPGVVHHRLVLEPAEAELVREAFELYVGQSGAKSVARTLNQRGYRTRAGALWSKNLVMLLLEEEALTGTVWWGRRKGRALRPKEEWPGRAPTRPKLLKGLAWCGKCGVSYQYETGGKTVINGHYTYGYYNCRNLLRVGKEACSGFRISTETLNAAVLGAITWIVCTEERGRDITSRRGWPLDRVLDAEDRCEKGARVER